jgi:hypothetical protein
MSGVIKHFRVSLLYLNKMVIKNLFQSWLFKQILTVLFLVLLFNGCNTSLEPDISGFGYEYYPTEIGDYRIYHSVTIRYNLDGSIDTTTYLMKEVAEDSIRYNDGLTRVILGRYSTEIDGNKWRKDSLWAVLVDDANVVVSEANKDFIKLSFPVAESKEWDGNSFNSGDSEFYKLKEVGKPYSYDTLSYQKTLTVVHKDLIDPIKITEDDYRIEVFAAGIGLIHKLKIKLNYCSSCVENGKIDDGFIFEQKLIEIGKE